MSHRPGHLPERWFRDVLSALAVAAVSVSCRGAASAAKTNAPITLRIGISAGELSSTNPQAGIRQIVQNVTTEGLARVNADGRMEPQLAQGWTPSPDGRSLRIDLKKGLRFSDGSPVDATEVAATLPDALLRFVGPVLSDGVRARVVGERAIQLDLDRPSPLFLEALEEPVRKRGAANISTGPFVPSATSPTELLATNDYYLGRPAVDVVRITSFPSVRSAWAELLRNNIDMLYEVGSDALDSLESSTTVSLFTFVRPYQYQIAFNSEAPELRSVAVRQALNFAIDREQVVREALNGHGVPSSAPLRSTHWAATGVPGFSFDPARAARMLAGKQVRFTCLLPLDPIYERLALHVQRQLAAVGVDMQVKSLPPDELFAAETTRKYDAVLTETISGPTLLRLYLVWHSSGARNLGRGTAGVDAALERVRLAKDESEYRQSVAAVQHAFIDDPPAVFLAWSERARAVSNRFVVPAPEPGRDVLATMRLWKPRNDERLANRN